MKSESSLSTIDPAKSISLIELQIQKAEELRVLASNDTARSQWHSTSRGLLVASFPPSHGILSNFDRNNHLILLPRDSPTKRQERRNRQLDGYIAVLKSAIEQLEWTLPADSQHFMPSGSQHDAFQLIRKIIQSTKTEICIVDNYVDDSTWKLLTNVPATVLIRVLTLKMKDDFPLEGKHFKSQHGNTVEVRKTDTDKVHDRFIIIDGATVWHLGPSIKDAGTKTAFMSEILSPTLVAAAVQEITNSWNVGTAVII